MSSLARGQPLAVHGVQVGVLADRGERPRVLPLELDPQQVQHVAPGQDLVQAVRVLRRRAPPSGARPASTGRRRSRGPRASSGPRCSTGRCGCGRCRRPGPRSAPRRRPRRWRMVRMSSRPCVGCSCGPSPALITAQPRFWASRCGVPGVRCRTTTTSTPMASMFLAVSMNVSPFEQAAGRGREIDRVGPQPPGGQREAGPRARRVLEEQVHAGLARQQRDLLRDRSVIACLKRSAVSRISVISSAERLLQLQQVPPGPRFGDGAHVKRIGAHREGSIWGSCPDGETIPGCDCISRNRFDNRAEERIGDRG